MYPNTFVGKTEQLVHGLEKWYADFVKQQPGRNQEEQP